MATNAEQQSFLPAGPVIMLLSAALFGYFGYQMQPAASDGKVVLFMAILMWTLRVSSVCFALSGILCLFLPGPANMLYALVGILGAVLLLVVAVMDMVDPDYSAAIPPFLLLIFVAWNGYGSWASLQALGRLPRTPGAGDDGSAPKD